MFPERSQSARRAMPVFFRELNDVNFYIEDTAEGYDRIYQNILTRLFIKKNINKIFAIGSRTHLLSEAEKNKSNKKSVYIIDGDLYLLGGEVEAIPDNVAILNRYCIENFLLDKDALNEIVSEEITTLTEESDDYLDFENWMSLSRIELKRLFILFSICHVYQTGIKNVSHGFKSVISNNNADLDLKKINNICTLIYNELSKKISQPYLDFKIKKIENSLDSSSCFSLKYVSGKDFLLPVFLIKMRKITNSRTANLVHKIKLSRRIDVGSFSDLKDKIDNILRRA